jgi:hypothetical protein
MRLEEGSKDPKERRHRENGPKALPPMMGSLPFSLQPERMAAL